MSASTVFGIDLGTTYSSIAHYADGVPQVIPNSEGQTITPSVVLFDDDDEVFIGQQAKNQRVTFPASVVESIKNQMGNDSFRFHAPNGTEHSPETVSALILKKLVADANDFLGTTANRVVITVPAYFDDKRRMATKQAAELAGLEVLNLINEPTAAAVAFGAAKEFEGSALVYDLGGGTFDVTLLDIKGGEFNVVYTDGDRNLGGRDWDALLITHLRKQFSERTGVEIGHEPAAEAMLRDRAEALKHTLSQGAKAVAYLSYEGRNEKIVVTREEFEFLSTDLVDRTRYILEEVMDGSGRDYSTVDRVLMVGGSTRMPMIGAMVRSVTGKEPDRSIHPDEAVSLGAALRATLLQAESSGGQTSAPLTRAGEEIVINDVTSHGVGVKCLNENGVLINSVLVSAQSTIPAHASKEFYTVVDDQSEIEVQVTIGDDSNLDFVSDAGACSMKIPPHPASSPVKVIVNYDIDQIIHVELYDVTDKRSLGEFEIERPGNLGQDEMQEFLGIVRNLGIQ